METKQISFLLPQRFSSTEQGQRARLLNYMLMAVFIGALVTGISNYLNGWVVETYILSLLTLVCLIGFYLNIKQQYLVAAGIFCISFYIVISLLLYHGAGLYDTTLLAYPIFMICVAFLFGKRGLLVASVFSILAAWAIYLLQITGLFQSSYHASLLRTVIVSLLFSIMALVTWVVRSAWETNLYLLNESYDLTLQGWARALEYRDGETAGHSRRVTELSVSVGRALSLGREDITNLRLGSYLHDIGKMAIPDRILLKPGPLTDDEWVIMRQHPVRSREFLVEIPFLKGAIPIAYSHHERWDGDGYPEGLKGEEIPLLARIFAVVDNWDALTSDRPYRKAWTDEKVAAYLKENARKMFDPHIVEVFLPIVSPNESQSTT
ncbi:MAG TPA: HD-GYP domain-containing protein [Anaerolineales bacterium]|nr:HD-GYP domain-containing protein [Anaerolineales bacterium]